MTEKDISNGDSRRSFMKKGALATGVLAVGASGSATAQTDGDDGDGLSGDLDEGWKALTFIDNFHPNARFTFVSGVIEWTPNYGDVRDSWFSDYNTYQIRWLNTDEIVPLFVAASADIGEYDEDLGYVPNPNADDDQPMLFEMNREWTPFDDNPRLITVNASAVDDDTADSILENEDWWQQESANGSATEANETTTEANETTTEMNETTTEANGTATEVNETTTEANGTTTGANNTTTENETTDGIF